MAITTADKIFVGVDDEINFVVEKILAAEKERVIIVIPQNALVVSSLVSMRILAKQIVKSKKLVVVVTEDEFGQKLAKSAGIISAAKVSNVTPEMWESVQIAKEKAKDAAKQRKEELLSERGIAVAAETAPEVVESDTEEQSELDSEVAPSDTEPEEVPAEEVVVDQPEDEIVEEEEKSPAVEAETASEEKDAKIVGPIQRKRRQPKLVDVGGIKIYAGGDIGQLMPENTAIENDPQPIPERVIRNASLGNKEGFTGRDWTNYTGDSKRKFSFTMPKLFAFKRGGGEVDEKEQQRRRRLIIIGIAIVAFCVFGATYVLAFQTSSVDVKIKLKTAEVPVEQQIVADVDAKALVEEPLTIPAELVTEEGLSISASDKSTGEGASGNIAAGVIDIWNKTSQEVSIPAGTVLENTTTNLKYVLKQDVVVPAGNSSGAVQGIGRKEDVSIEAEKFGEEYNITESGTKIDFKVGSYATADVIGKRFRAIEGGTTETFKAPSTEDVEKVKAALLTNITKQGVSKIKNLIPEGYRLLEGSEKFEETAVRSTPEVGKKGDTFSVTLEGKMTAVIVANDNLEEAITLMIDNTSTQSEEGTEFEVKTLGDAVLSEIVREANKVTFKVVSKGSLTSKITEESIKQNIAGKTISEAEEYLIKLTEIETSSITFNPTFIPGFLRRVPTDWGRVKIVLQ